MKIIALIPAFNEEKTIGGVLTETHDFVDETIVVNDGSTDRTAIIAKAQGAVVLSHILNRGLGAALGTGFAAAKQLNADILITLDADGQHDPHEIQKLVVEIERGADVVIGSRMFSDGMPFTRRLANSIGNLITFFLFGAWVSDSQSGFRAFSRYALSKIEILSNHMEVSSEFIAQAKQHELSLVEVPIQAIYSSYSLSKGQNFYVGLKTLFKLIVQRLTQ